MRDRQLQQVQHTQHLQHVQQLQQGEGEGQAVAPCCRGGATGSGVVQDCIIGGLLQLLQAWEGLQLLHLLHLLQVLQQDGDHAP